MNYEELIIFERVYIRRRWWQSQSNSRPSGENPGENQRPINEANQNRNQAENLIPFQIEGLSRAYLFQVENYPQML